MLFLRKGDKVFVATGGMKTAVIENWASSNQLVIDTTNVVVIPGCEEAFELNLRDAGKRLRLRNALADMVALGLGGEARLTWEDNYIGDLREEPLMSQGLCSKCYVLRPVI